MNNWIRNKMTDQSALSDAILGSRGMGVVIVDQKVFIEHFERLFPAKGDDQEIEC